MQRRDHELAHALSEYGGYTIAMRILFVSSGLRHEYGGAAVSEASLVAALSRKHEVRVLCRKGRWDFEFSKLWGFSQVEEFSPKEVVSAWGDSEHWLSKRIKGVDVFHLNGHWYWENYLFSRMCLKYRTPYLLHPRGMLVLNKRRPIMKRLFNLFIGNETVRNAARVIALSRFEIAQFKSYSLEMDRVAVIPNGIIAPHDISEPKTLPKGIKKYFLYLGRVSPRKNLLFLIDAFQKFSEESYEPALLIVGPSDKPYVEKLKRLIQKRGLEKKIHFCAPVYEAEKWAYLKSATAVIYPAVEEAFGRVPFEAVAVKTFPIIPRESGGAEYLAPFLPFSQYEQHSAASLIQAMRSVLHAGPGEFTALQKANRWVDERLQWNRIAKEVVSLYESALLENSQLTASAGSSIPSSCLVLPKPMTS
jgi:glycosyltransferase involved in cell wall biosynthesis